MFKVIENGVEKRIESWKITIPLHDNDNIKFPEQIIDEIKNKIIDEFSGLSIINCIGLWKDNNKIYKDDNIIIIVDIPVDNSKNAESYFIKMKETLSNKLNQEKIYITKTDEKSEILSKYEFLKELGFEVIEEEAKLLTQENLNILVSEYKNIKKRLSYKTLCIKRDFEKKIIIWEREIFGIKLLTKIDDHFSKDFILLSADKLESYFTEELFGKPLILIGDYEYQSYILDKEKRNYVIGNPEQFKKYNVINHEPMYGKHSWHGTLSTSEFIPVYVEQILINYILLREYGFSNKDILINVGADGSMQKGNGKLLTCPAPIPSKKVQKVIIKKLSQAIKLYENGTINEIALMQAKVLNRFNEKKAMLNSKM